MDELKDWHKAYMSEDGETIGLESPIVLAVDADRVDHDAVEQDVQQCVSATRVAQGFCQRCQHLFDHWPNLGVKSWTHAVVGQMRTEELEAGTRAGCKACAFMFTQMKEANIVDTIRKIEQRLRRLEEPSHFSLSITNWGVGGETLLLWINFPGKVTTGCNADWAMKTKFESHADPRVTENERGLDNKANGSADGLTIAARWLQNCDERHKACGHVPNEQEPPGRLLFVGDMIRLVNTSDMETLPRYATMSYCWGSEDFYKLTVGTMDELSRGIPPERLPQAFRDAFSIVQRIGLQYIWIDALCIIQSQDDDTDWTHETGRMRSVYGNAYVNIAATSITSVHAGCFSKPADYSGGFQAQVTTDAYRRSQSFFIGEVYVQSTSDTNLATRAWTVQEKLLPRCTLSVGDRGLFWECRSTIASEFLPDGFPGKLGTHLVRPEDQAWPWFDIVGLYSKGKLTFSSDKLPALSGIARRQHEATGEEYLAGLWRRHLVKQLAWMPHGKCQRPAWRAPTWSWMSIDAETFLWPQWENEDLGQNEHVQILDARTTPASANPFGSITAGSIRLRCKAMVAADIDKSQSADDGADSSDTLATPKADEDYVVLDGETRLFPVTMDCEEVAVVNDPKRVLLLPLFDGRSGTGRFATPVDIKAGSDTDDEREVFDELMIRGLLLQNTGSEKGCFRRVGCFDYRYDTLPGSTETGNYFYRALLEAIERVGISTAKEECSEESVNETDPTMKYVITIV